MTASEKHIRQIAVVGAGPAGLVAALAAHKLGFSVKVFEQAADFAKVGGGTLAANTSTAAHLARNILFAASRNLSFLRRRNLLITAGYNPLENEYLDAFEDEN